MKKGTKITINALLIALLVLIAFEGGMNAVLSHLASRELNRVLAWLPEGEASCGNVRVELITGTATLEDVSFVYHRQSESPDQPAPGVEMHVESIEIGRIFFKLLTDKQALLNSITIVGPSVELWMDEDNPQLCFPDFKKDTTRHLQFPFQHAELHHFNIEKASLALHSTHSHLDVTAEAFSFSVHDLMYDSVFTYNDSVYSISLASANVTLPDGRTHIQTRDLAFENRGKLIVGATRMTNVLTGKKPAVPGLDVQLDRIEVGALSHAELFDGQLSLSTIDIVRPRVELWLDEDNPETCFPVEKKTLPAQPLTLPFQWAELQHLTVKNGSLAMHSTRSKLDVAAEKFSLSVTQLAYDSLFRCDTIFDFSLARLAVRLPDGEAHLEAKDIVRRDLKGFSVGKTTLSTLPPTEKPGDMPASQVQIDRIEFGPVSYTKLFDLEAIARVATLVRPRVEIWLDEENPEMSFPAFAKKEVNKTATPKKSKSKTKAKPQEASKLVFPYPFKKVALQHVNIENASFALHSLCTNLDVLVDSCSLAYHHLSYTNAFHCDSVFSFSLAHVSVLLPDGSMELDTRNVIHQDRVGLTIGPTRMVSVAKDLASGKIPGADIRTERVEIGTLAYSQLLDKKVRLSSVKIVRPTVELWLDEENPELSFPTTPERKDKKPVTPSRIETFLKHLSVENASFALHSTRTKLDLLTDSLSLAVHNLSYIPYKSYFGYCDSVYSFCLKHASVLIPDGKIRIEAHDLAQVNAGPLTLGATYIGHTMDKMELGNQIKEPTTWLQMHMESFKTVPFNPIRKALKKDYTLSHADVVIRDMDVMRDLRYKAIRPFPMIQEAFKDLDVPVYIGSVGVELKKIHIELTSTDINSGSLDLSDIHATAENITTKKNSTIRVKGLCPIAPGTATVEMELTMNDNCDFYTRLHAENVDASFLNTLIRPLVGMTCSLLIDTLDTRYKGNLTEAKGTYKMLYHDFGIKVHKKDDIPFKIVTRTAHTINVVGNTLIPKSNPLTPHGHPKAYNISWKRNEWQPTELYIFGPVINGVVKTLLPGLFIMDRTKILNLE